MADAVAISQPALVVKNRGLLIGAIMLAMVMQVLDTTIANVALPHMRAALSASQDEVSWVLTSYIVAAAIATPLSGWLADRLGRRNLLLIGVSGFTAASLLCGIATSLPEMVMFRILQGVFGATLAPLAQAIMMDVTPREKMGQSMAIFGLGVMVAPIIGPTLGGVLTENFDWRWVFLVNLPVGILAFVALWFNMPKETIKIRRFDFFGFAMLAIAVASTQLIFDRGSSVDWFASAEIWLYLGLAISGIGDRHRHPDGAARPRHDGLDAVRRPHGRQGRCAHPRHLRHRHLGLVAVVHDGLRPPDGWRSDHDLGLSPGHRPRPRLRAAEHARLRHHRAAPPR